MTIPAILIKKQMPNIVAERVLFPNDCVPPSSGSHLEGISQSPLFVWGHVLKLCLIKHKQKWCVPPLDNRKNPMCNCLFIVPISWLNTCRHELENIYVPELLLEAENHPLLLILIRPWSEQEIYFNEPHMQFEHLW